MGITHRPYRGDVQKYVLCFVFGTVTDGGGWKGTCLEILLSVEREMVWCKCEWMQAFEFSILRYISGNVNICCDMSC